MMRLVRAGATIAMLAICAGQARADLASTGLPSGTQWGSSGGSAGGDPMFTFTFTGGGIDASGILNANANGDGTFTATGNTMSFTSTIGGDPGTYGLIQNPTPTGEVYSPSGAFIYDDQVLPGQNPLITNGGLLFGNGTLEFNIFSNGPGPGTYSFYEYNPNGGYVAIATGNFTLTAVPEPSAVFIASFGSIAFAAYGWRRRRVSQA